MSPRRTFPHSPLGGPPDEPDVHMREMGRKIQAKAIEKGWNPAELGRQVAKRLPDKRLTRTDIYKYWRGETLPGVVRRKAIAAALEMSEAELFSGVSAPITDKSPPLAKMSLLSGGNALLEVNLTVSADIASEVMAILGKANVISKKD